MIWQEKAISRIRQVLSAETNLFTKQIRAAARLKGSESAFRRIAQANDAEQMSDYFAEIRFGLMFAQLHFENGWFNPRRGQRIYTESFQQLSQPFLSWADDLRGL